MSIKSTKKSKATSNFSFQWDSKKTKAKAIVFPRRKQKKVEEVPENKATSVPPANSTQKFDFHKRIEETTTTDILQTSSTNPDESTYDNAPKSGPFGHIKRKQKKDKLLTNPVNSHEQPNYNLFSVKHKDIYVNTSAGKSVSEKVFTSCPFNDMGIHPHLVSNLEKHGFLKSTNVQSKAIPVISSGKNTLVRSQTGSGKTLAYAVPIIDALQGIQPRLKRTDGIQAIIIVPTRELALQTHELFNKINTFQWLVVNLLCGGENRKTEKDRIKKGMSVVIGTPGRLLDHVLHTTAMKIEHVRCLVLDEADRLLDMGFRKDIVSLVEALDKAKSNTDYNPMQMLKRAQPEEVIEGDKIEESTAPPLKNLKCKERQNIMLSATLTKAVSELASFTMKDHTYIDALDLTSNAIVNSYVIPDTVKQEFIMTHAKHRLFTLSALLLYKSKHKSCKLFVFMASTQMVEFHAELFSKYLRRMPINRGKRKIGDESNDEEEEEVMDTRIFKLHGSMDQKERKEVFKGFRAAKKGILICTDVVARGIDVPAADCIIQYTGPQMDEDYLHRVGRTGRAGHSGSAIIFLTHEEQDYVDHLRTHRVFLTKRDQAEYLQELSIVMEEPNYEQAATLLQRRFETAVERDKSLHRLACFAYSTWSRFYNSYPVKMRKFFDFKKANLGHYVTTFALRLTPTAAARIVRGEVTDVEKPKLNKKLANHRDNAELQQPRGRSQPGQKRKPKINKSVSLGTSEFHSGLESVRKKRKKDE